MNLLQVTHLHHDIEVGETTAKGGFSSTRVYIQKVLDQQQHAEQAYRSCQGILSLAKRVGNERLNNACKRADYFGEYSYKTVKTILERKLDFTDLDSDEKIKPMPPHENIRGKKYYK